MLTHKPTPTAAQAPILTFEDSIYKSDASPNIVIAEQTVRPGSSAVYVDSTPISIGTEASYAIIGGITHAIAVRPSSIAPILTLGSSTFTADSSSHYST